MQTEYYHHLFLGKECFCSFYFIFVDFKFRYKEICIKGPRKEMFVLMFF